MNNYQHPPNFIKKTPKNKCMENRKNAESSFVCNYLNIQTKAKNQMQPKTEEIKTTFEH